MGSSEVSENSSKIVISKEEFMELKYSALKAIVAAIADSSARWTYKEFARIMADSNVQEHLDDIMPYMYASALLSFSGREINDENISRLFNAFGFTVNREITKTLTDKANMKSHLLCIYVYYFLVALGKENTPQNMLKAMDALGAVSEKSRVDDVLKFLVAQPATV